MDFEQHIIAREGLLDAVEALGPNRNAVILVGVQASYVHTRNADSDLVVSPFMLDADIAIEPDLLGDDPTIIEAMSGARFKLTAQPGIYTKDDGSQLDLLVPEAVDGTGSRGARVGVHGNRAPGRLTDLRAHWSATRPQQLALWLRVVDGPSGSSRPKHLTLTITKGKELANVTQSSHGI